MNAQLVLTLLVVVLMTLASRHAVAADPLPRDTAAQSALPERLVLGHLYFVALTESIDHALVQAAMYQADTGIGPGNALGGFSSELVMASGWERAYTQGSDQRSVISLRLQYLTALKHYRQGNFAEFLADITTLRSAGWVPMSIQSQYLVGEYHRLQDQPDEALAYLSAIRGHLLGHYLRFNLAVDAAAAEDNERAQKLLRPLMKTRATSEEVFELQSRATLVLALLRQRADENSEKLLLAMDSASRYAPGALALISNMRMQRGDYQRAAGFLSQLLTRYPDSVEARSAHYSYAYATEQTGDWRHGLASYVAAEKQLVAQAMSDQNFLDSVSGDIRQVLVAGAPGQPGHEALAAWRPQEAVQVGLVRLHWLHNRASRLHADLDSIEVLAGVAQEQVRRSGLLASQLAQGQFDQRLKKHSEQKTRLIDFYAGYSDWSLNDPRLINTMSDEERLLLSDVDNLAASAVALGAPATSLQRIARLRGVINYQAYDDLPVRARQKVRRLLSLPETKVADRMSRIAAADGQLQSVTGVPARLLALRNQLVAVQPVLANQIAALNGHLIAELQNHIQTRLADVEQQLALTRLAMARIADEQLLAEVSP